jgi:hypothetical protein
MNKEFGGFGSGKPVTKSGYRFASLLKWLLLLAVLALIPWAASGWADFYRTFGEGQPPTIEIVKPPAGLGVEPLELTIRVKDDQSGLDQVIVRAEQGNELRDILRKDYPTKQMEDTVKLTLQGKASGFREGDLRLLILAFDRSFWSNSAKATFQLRVDYEPPKIEMLSTQHNAVRGGVELAIYKIVEEKNIFSGVMVGSQLFPGFPASKLDGDFAATPDVHFAFFAIPLDFNEVSDVVQLFARDVVGNTSTMQFFYRVKDLRTPETRVEVPRVLLESRIDELFKKYEEIRAVRSGQPPPGFVQSGDDEELQRRFMIVNGEFRQMIADDLRPIFSRPKAERFWAGDFARPPGRILPYSFGELIDYVFQGNELGSVVQQGVSFMAAEGTQVRAGNSGIIIFADDLGVYGKTVVIDHGFGLTTLYAHLSSINQLEGERVAAGQVIGLSGSTGLVWRGEIGFEIRLHGVPVRPEEWWDKTWIQGHIEDKIEDMKKRLGIRVRKALE